MSSRERPLNELVAGGAAARDAGENGEVGPVVLAELVHEIDLLEKTAVAATVVFFFGV